MTTARSTGDAELVLAPVQRCRCESARSAGLPTRASAPIEFAVTSP